jgi:hypothetical protein
MKFVGMNQIKAESGNVRAEIDYADEVLPRNTSWSKWAGNPSNKSKGKSMKKMNWLAMVVALLTFWQGIPTTGAAVEKQPVVQIALLLDTSSSMDGLIAQAKSQLWKIVNEFINAKQNGVRPV